VDTLTPRQVAILDMICRERLSTSEIARRMFVEPSTVQKYLNMVYRALFDHPGIDYRRSRAGQWACYEWGRAARD
jgi:DNA-binding NarL/FixJ family response regulator